MVAQWASECESGPDPAGAVERDAALVVPEHSAPLSRATVILPQQVQDALVSDDLGQSIQEQKVVDEGVVGFDIGPEHEAISGYSKISISFRSLSNGG